MEEKFVVFKTGRNELTKVIVNEILYFKADGGYTHIKTIAGNSFTICNNLKNTIAEVDSDIFIKINRSVVLNHLYITKVKTGKDPMVQLNNNKTFRPSKKYHNHLKQIFVHTLNGDSHTVKGGVSHIFSSRSHNKPNEGKK